MKPRFGLLPALSIMTHSCCKFPAASNALSLTWFLLRRTVAWKTWQHREVRSLEAYNSGRLDNLERVLRPPSLMSCHIDSSRPLLSHLTEQPQILQTKICMFQSVLKKHAHPLWCHRLKRIDIYKETVRSRRHMCTFWAFGWHFDPQWIAWTNTAGASISWNHSMKLRPLLVRHEAHLFLL